MNDKEALAAIEKEMACRKEGPDRCHQVASCLSCPHFVDPEKLYDAMAVAVRALREEVSRHED